MHAAVILTSASSLNMTDCMFVPDWIKDRRIVSALLFSFSPESRTKTVQQENIHVNQSIRTLISENVASLREDFSVLFGIHSEVMIPSVTKRSVQLSLIRHNPRPPDF